MPHETTLRALQDFQPEWGVVLGSGLAGICSSMSVLGRLSYAEVPGLPPACVPGHSGELQWGTFAGQRVVVVCGRVHLYEGRTAAEVTATIRLMADLGVQELILTNAAGCLNPTFRPGVWMAIADHLNLTGASPLIGGPNFFPMAGLYSPALRARFRTAAETESIPLFEGVYAGVVGPQYETPAEIRMLQRLGADAVGMSTVLEAIQAHALGLEMAAFSCLTNWAAGLGDEPLSHASVLAAGREAAESFWQILTRGIQDG